MSGDDFHRGSSGPTLPLEKRSQFERVVMQHHGIRAVDDPATPLRQPVRKLRVLARGERRQRGVKASKIIECPPANRGTRRVEPTERNLLGIGDRVIVELRPAHRHFHERADTRGRIPDCLPHHRQDFVWWRVPVHPKKDVQASRGENAVVIKEDHQVCRGCRGPGVASRRRAPVCLPDQADCPARGIGPAHHGLHSGSIRRPIIDDNHLDHERTVSLQHPMQCSGKPIRPIERRDHDRDVCETSHGGHTHPATVPGSSPWSSPSAPARISPVRPIQLPRTPRAWSANARSSSHRATAADPGPTPSQVNRQS